MAGTLSCTPRGFLRTAAVSLLLLPVLTALQSQSPARAQDAGVVPANAAALFPYLQSGAYRAFSHESAIHQSTGAHPRVLTYINPKLEAALRRGKRALPKGSAAVKELYNANDVLIGWSVMVKTAKQSRRGRGWYWYEIASTTDPSDPDANGKGAQPCVGCHAVGGKDFFQSPFPLR
jgi:hypothetical protein